MRFRGRVAPLVRLAMVQPRSAGRRRMFVVLSSPTGVPLVYRCPGELYFAYSWSAIAPISARAAARPLVR